MTYVQKDKKILTSGFFFGVLCVVSIRQIINNIKYFERSSYDHLTNFQVLMKYLFSHNVFLASYSELLEIESFLKSRGFHKNISFQKYFSEANAVSFGILYRDITDIIKVSKKIFLKIKFPKISVGTRVLE